MKYTVESIVHNNGRTERTTLTIEEPLEVWLSVEGYIDLHGEPQLIMLCHDPEEGLLLFVWADKTKEDPTHRISLEGAKKHT